MIQLDKGLVRLSLMICQVQLRLCNYINSPATIIGAHRQIIMHIVLSPHGFITPGLYRYQIPCVCWALACVTVNCVSRRVSSPLIHCLTDACIL